MDRRGFRRFLKARGADKAEMRRSLAVARRFEAFCRREARSSAGEAPMDLAIAFAAMLAKSGDAPADLSAVARYARFVANRRALVVFLGALDGHKVFSTLLGRIEAALGRPAGAELFADVEAPTLGSSGLERAHRTHVLVDRLELMVGREEAAALIG